MRAARHYPVQAEPPIADVRLLEDPEGRTLTYQYNGRPLIAIYVGGTGPIHCRKDSDACVASSPLLQQIYVTLDDAPSPSRVVFELSPDALCMRPGRATQDQAILGQVGHASPKE